MQQSDFILHPGETVFFQESRRIRTVLGSCVAVTVWHPGIKIGGMCHFLLERPQQEGQKVDDDRYGEVALEHLYEHMCQHAIPEAYELGVFGGGNLFSRRAGETIGERNVAFTNAWLRKHGLEAKTEHVLGNLCRTLVFDLSDGAIYLKRYKPEFEGAEE